MSASCYLDDDTGIPSLVEQAAARELTIVRSDDVGMRGCSDAEHLAYAASNGLALVSCNRRDFLRLHYDYVERGSPHSGIIVVDQAIPRGERIRRLLFLCEVASQDDLANRVEFLFDWA